MKLHRFLTTKILATIALAGLLSACDDATPKEVVQQPAPVQQPAQQTEPQVVYVQPDQQQQQPQVVYEQAPQQPQTVVVQQPQYDSTGHLLNTIVTMHAMNSLLGNNGGGNRTVVNKTVVNKTYVNKTVPAKPYYGSQSIRRAPVSNVRSNSFSTSRSYNSKPLKISTSRPSYYKSRRR